MHLILSHWPFPNAHSVPDVVPALMAQSAKYLDVKICANLRWSSEIFGCISRVFRLSFQIEDNLAQRKPSFFILSISLLFIPYSIALRLFIRGYSESFSPAPLRSVFHLSCFVLSSWLFIAKLSLSNQGIWLVFCDTLADPIDLSLPFAHIYWLKI